MFSQLTEAYRAPWKLRNECARAMTAPWVRLYLAACGVRADRTARVYGKPMVQRYRGSTIEIGPGVQLRSSRRSNPLVPVHPVALSTRTATAEIVIGEHAGITGATIVSARSVRIGRRVPDRGQCHDYGYRFSSVDRRGPSR